MSADARQYDIQRSQFIDAIESIATEPDERRRYGQIEALSLTLLGPKPAETNQPATVPASQAGGPYAKQSDYDRLREAYNTSHKSAQRLFDKLADHLNKLRGDLNTTIEAINRRFQSEWNATDEALAAVRKRHDEQVVGLSLRVAALEAELAALKGQDEANDPE